jgi:hypothetical protein
VLVDLDSIDRVVSLLSQEQRDQKAKQGVAQDRIADVIEELKGTEAAVDMDLELSQVEQNQTKANDLRVSAVMLEDVLANITLQSTKVADRRLASAEGGKVVDVGKQVVELRDQVLVLDGLVESILSARKRAKNKPDLSEVAVARREVDVVRGEVERLESLLDQVTRAEGNRDMLREDRDKAEKELKDKTGGQCPLCGGKM